MPADSSTSPLDPEAIPPRHHRTVLFYGEERFGRIQEARVTVIGLGGVGGHAAVNLARSGIGALHLVDFDTVTDSSLNRSPFAEPADVGRLKTDALHDYLARVCPDTRVTVTEAFCGDDTLPELVPPNAAPDLVIDAIDSLNPKVALLEWCRRHGIPVITSMGAAGKRDVGQVRTGDLGDSTICRLASKVRSRLKKRGVMAGIPAVWSIEKGAAHRPGAPKEVGVETDGDTPAATRERHTLASQMTLPGVFGYGLAAMALDLLSRKENP
ncbi:MAG: tRNA threonylcarbamoyladenosine dehydratase [Candidatus Krumholzibacteriota bacterium]